MPSPDLASTIALPNTVPTIADVEQISRIENAVIRNLRITQCYCELSKAFSARIAGSANWCTFATWASKQAGVSIRGEDLQRVMGDALKSQQQVSTKLAEISTHVRSMGSSSSPEQIQQRLLDSVVNEVKARISDAVARGNKKVFEEIGREFARFIEICLTDEVFREEKIENFCKQLRDGNPPEGQDFLKRAFHHYYQSFFEPDAKKRQELVLLANVEIGFHEQTRLQPEIAESLNAVLVDAEHVKEFVKNVLLTNLGTVGQLIYLASLLRGKKSLLNQTIEKLVAEVQPHLHKLVTAVLMTLTVPVDRELHLGQDLDAQFPTNLKALDNEELKAFLLQIDPTTDSLRESGATDWSDLKERLHYIADLFRCFHEDKDMYCDAFTAAQIDAFKKGKLPEGRL